MTTLVSTTNGVVLTDPPDSNPVVIKQGTTITDATGGENAIAAYTGIWTIQNAGTVEAAGTSGAAVYLVSGGTVTNQTTGVIGYASSNLGAIYIQQGAGTVTNFGLINAGVWLQSGGAVTNQTGGRIISRSTSGGYGVGLNAGGAVTNAGTISGPFVGIDESQGGGTVTNELGGTITGNYAGVLMGFVGQAGPGGRYVTNQAGGTIIGDTGVLAGGAVATVTNAGVIEGTVAGTVSNGGITLVVGAGVSMSPGGAVTNLSGGTITGASYGVYIGGGTGTVFNSGTIAGTSGFGVALLDGGYVSNAAGGAISSVDTSGVYAPGAGAVGTMNNAGLIRAGGTGRGVDFRGGGTVTNQSTGTIISDNNNGIFINGATGTVVNAGSIVAEGATHSAVNLFMGGYVSNAASGEISAVGATGIYAPGAVSTVNNAGLILAGTTGSGIDFRAGGSVTNQSTGTISASKNLGVYINGGAGTVINAGLLLSSLSSGVEFKVGGSITNASTGTISGGGRDGVQVTGGAGTVVNTGTIVGGVFDGVLVGGGPDTVINAGTISGATDAVQFTAGYANRLIIDPGAMFIGTVTGGNTLGATAVSTLELASGTSTGTLTGLGSKYIDFAQVTIDAGASWTVQGTVESGETAAFAGVGSYLHLENPGSVAGSVTNFAVGDTIDLKGINPASVSYSAGTLNFSGGSFALALAAPGSVHATPSGDGADVTVLCFCANTQILTPSGERPVQDLAVGDLVTTHRGEARPIVWLGIGKVMATRGRRNAATPVIVRKGALADNVPNRDLRVTKGHALHLDDVLIPVEFLVNHRSIEWDDRAQAVELYHIELATHDVLVANGAPAESYRDDGNRWLFHNANTGWGLPPLEPCAPVLTGGAVVDEVWRRLLERAGSRPGVPVTDDPELHLLVDGQRVDAAQRHGDRHVFRLTGRPEEVHIVSRTGAPQELGLTRDPRSLGVALRQIMLTKGKRVRIIDAENPLLTDGFHAFEADNGFRWTDGDAAIPTGLFAGFTGPLELVLHIGGTARYLADEPEQRAA